MGEVKKPKQKCGFILKNGKSCNNYAVLNGFCVIHFEIDNDGKRKINMERRFPPREDWFRGGKE